MDSKYNPKEHEDKIYSLWESSDSFKPNLKAKGKPFTIILPPPNANAPLHYGHAMYTVEDVLIRYHRMKGSPTLWLPGADHAGFETQVVYEKHLSKEGKSRFDFDNKTLYKNIWDFVKKNRGTMENQLRKLGFSLDWSRPKFTLDPDIVKTVHTTFKKLFDDELIYRDAKLVNYCTKHGTAFSDLEVKHVEKQDKLYYIKFPLKENPDKFIIIATTRPETIPGDIAIAVNPKDKRYKNLVGKTVLNPLNDREMKIIADDYVEADFGTGALKITPAHDDNDFNLAKKYNLELIQVIGFDGKMNQRSGKYEGLKTIPAREKILEDLKQKGLFEKEKDYTHSVGTCYKCGNNLEPLPLPQWYIKMEGMAKKAMKVVEDGDIKILPKRFEKTYFHWLKNIHDWNISRQIVWGIQIPAFKCDKCNKWTATDGETPKKCSSCKHTKLTQDKDTFDTWFSSSQWPFATLGYPNKSDYKTFYPTSVMETGYDILFFWVARMIMLGIYTTGKVPFKNVFLHGMVRDSKGQKMSKSKGNVVNPLDVAEKFGTDALRMSLIAGSGAGNDQNYSEAKVIGYRNFTNKIWNIGRYVQFVFDGTNNISFDKPKKLIKEDEKILKSLDLLIEKVTTNLEKYRLNTALEAIYEFAWHEFADVYIEETKDRAREKDEKVLYTLRHTYLMILKLLHPFASFVTEAIWQEFKNLRKYPTGELITASWPKT